MANARNRQRVRERTAHGQGRHRFVTDSNRDIKITKGFVVTLFESDLGPVIRSERRTKHTRRSIKNGGAISPAFQDQTVDTFAAHSQFTELGLSRDEFKFEPGNPAFLFECDPRAVRLILHKRDSCVVRTRPQNDRED